ncbi:MAG: phage major capsid protein, partial [Solimonas sp.]
IRGLARKFSVTSAESLGVPSLDTDISDADWTTELAIGGEDSSMAFGKRELHPHPLGKLVKVSNKLLRVAALSPESLVRDRLAYKFGVTEEKAFMTGDGAGKPLGVFTASAQGISTARDVSTGNTATSIGADGLIEAQHTLKPQYWASARWIFHRDAVKQIRKLKYGQGQYLWQPGLRGGVPNEILGMPYIMSEYAPNTFTTGLYVGIIGDFSQYWIADALTLQVQRLVELYAATNQTGFIGRLETDGMPALEEAFVRVKLA